MLAASWVLLLLGRLYFCVGGGECSRDATGEDGPEEAGLRRSFSEDIAVCVCVWSAGLPGLSCEFVCELVCESVCSFCNLSAFSCFFLDGLGVENWREPVQRIFGGAQGGRLVMGEGISRIIFVFLQRVRGPSSLLHMYSEERWLSQRRWTIRRKNMYLTVDLSMQRGSGAQTRKVNWWAKRKHAV